MAQQVTNQQVCFVFNVRYQLLIGSYGSLSIIGLEKQGLIPQSGLSTKTIITDILLHRLTTVVAQRQL